MRKRIIIRSKPCAECDDCIPIGGGEGLCDFPFAVKDKFIVNLFDIESNCPKMKQVEKKKIGQNILTNRTK